MRVPLSRSRSRLGGLGERRKRILEHLRLNLACFGNIFKWLLCHRNLWKNWKMIVSLNTAYLITVAQLNYTPLSANCGTAYKISSTTYTRETHIFKIISVIDSREETGGWSPKNLRWGDGPRIRPPIFWEVVFVGCVRKHEQSKKGVVKELF